MGTANKLIYKQTNYFKEDGESNGMVAVSTMRPPASGLGVR